MKRSVVVAALIAPCLFALSAFAATQVPLDLLTGTWEVTTRTTIRGNPMTPAQMAQLPVRERAALRTFIKSKQGKPESNVSRECMSAQDMSDVEKFGIVRAAGCSIAVLESTPGRLSLESRCTGGDTPGRHGSAITTTMGQRRYHSVSHLDGTGSDTLRSLVEIDAVWIAAECNSETN
jgi:Protein of unknown function (DUF3617)